MSTVEILRAAKARIDTPEKWWQKNDACESPIGMRTCAWLAIEEFDPAHQSLSPAAFALARVIGGTRPEHIAPWNDTHTHAQVMAAFSRAIELEEAREQEFTVTEELMVA